MTAILALFGWLLAPQGIPGIGSVAPSGGGGGGGGGPALVTSGSHAFSGAGEDVNIGDTTDGDILYVVNQISAGYICAPTDTVGGQHNTWTKDQEFPGTGKLQIWSVPLVNKGANHVLHFGGDNDCYYSGSVDSTIAWEVWSGMTQKDGTVANQNYTTSPATTLTTGSVTPSSGGYRLLIAGFGMPPLTSGYVATSIDSGFTMSNALYNVGTTANHYSVAMAHFLETSGGVAKNPQWTFQDPGQNWPGAAIVSYKP